MKKSIIPILALALLACLSAGADAQGNALGKDVASLFSNQEIVKQVSYEAWKTARDQGLKVCLEKSAALLKMVDPADDKVPPQAAANTFAAWWYNVAGQYWSEIRAKRAGGDEFSKAIEAIKIAREVLEKALGWDAATADKHFQEAYSLMKSYQ